MHKNSRLAMLYVEDILTLDRVVDLILRETSLLGNARLVMLATAFNRGRIDPGTAAAYCGLSALEIDSVLLELVARRFLKGAGQDYKNQKMVAAFEKRVDLHPNHGPHA